MTVMVRRHLAGDLRDMSNIIKYESKIIANVEYELRGLINNLDHYPHKEIKSILEYSLADLRDNKIE